MKEYLEEISSAEVDAGDRTSHSKEDISCLGCKSSYQCKADEKYACTVIAGATMLVLKHRSR